MQAIRKIDFDIHLFEITLFLIDMRIYLLNNRDLAPPRIPATVAYQTLNTLMRQIPARKEGHEPKRRKKNV